MNDLKLLLMDIRDILDMKLFSMGGTVITPMAIIELIFITTISFLFSKIIRRIFQRRVLPTFKLADGVKFNILRLIHYTIIIIGLLVAINLVGLQLTSLAVIFGLMGVGIAFGLQNITSNFISGIILMFERPISVGDYIEVEGTGGIVRAINIRATTISTLDNITLIIPNSRFVESTVTNWSVGDPKVRINIPVGVAYGSDTEMVTKILLKAAENHPKVISEPKPDVLFRGFGDSSLHFELRIWILHAPDRSNIISDLNYAIDAAFRENKITIPFPQRDVHFYPSLIQ